MSIRRPGRPAAASRCPWRPRAPNARPGHTRLYHLGTPHRELVVAIQLVGRDTDNPGSGTVDHMPDGDLRRDGHRLRSVVRTAALVAGAIALCTVGVSSVAENYEGLLDGPLVTWMTPMAALGCCGAVALLVVALAWLLVEYVPRSPASQTATDDGNDGERRRA